ncbi:hypothetical protein M408DRAFT_307781 [Serendipita vermifera MAFF 305830]|uniref:Uncharacterized protein n=1 Tax=Serendipita vermifera MAFF 305830 TaxID=933852 RepID=A0A0C3B8P1_SERVB|nr:hypothetical protein M408DRAFT_307781 [Serendipita vermifera MAFF 305830]
MRQKWTTNRFCSGVRGSGVGGVVLNRSPTLFAFDRPGASFLLLSPISDFISLFNLKITMHLTVITAAAVLAYSVQTLAAPLPEPYVGEYHSNDPVAAVHGLVQFHSSPDARRRIAQMLRDHPIHLHLPFGFGRKNVVTPKAGGPAAIPKGSKRITKAKNTREKTSDKPKSVGESPKSARGAKAKKLQTNSSHQSKSKAQKSKITHVQKAASAQKAKSSKKKHVKRDFTLEIEERDFEIGNLD